MHGSTTEKCLRPTAQGVELFAAGLSQGYGAGQINVPVK